MRRALRIITLCALSCLATPNAWAEDPIDAAMRAGDTVWKASCPGGPVDQVCARWRKARGTTCLGQAARRPAVRRPRAARAAQRHYERAIDAYRIALRHPEFTPTKALETAVSRARLRLALLAHEELLARPFPTGLDFEPAHAETAKRSKKRFLSWVTDATKTVMRAEKAYAALLKKGIDRATQARAAQGMGDLYAHYALLLIGDSLPKLGGPMKYRADLRRAYCDQLNTTAEPLLDKAQMGYRECARLSGRACTPPTSVSSVLVGLPQTP